MTRFVIAMSAYLFASSSGAYFLSRALWPKEAQRVGVAPIDTWDGDGLSTRPRKLYTAPGIFAGDKPSESRRIYETYTESVAAGTNPQQLASDVPGLSFKYEPARRVTMFGNVNEPLAVILPGERIRIYKADGTTIMLRMLDDGRWQKEER